MTGEKKWKVTPPSPPPWLSNGLTFGGGHSHICGESPRPQSNLKSNVCRVIVCCLHDCCFCPSIRPRPVLFPPCPRPVPHSLCNNRRVLKTRHRNFPFQVIFQNKRTYANGKFMPVVTPHRFQAFFLSMSVHSQ